MSDKKLDPNALGEAAAADRYDMPLPQFTMEGDLVAPRYSGGMSLPFGGGDLGVSGNYMRPPNAPPDAKAMLTYRRRF